VKFPEAYQAPNLAARPATFAVTASAVDAPRGHDERRFRQDARLGIARQAARGGRRSHQRASTPAHRAENSSAPLLDQLDGCTHFEPPPSLVEQEFNSVWSSIEGDLKAQNRTFADEERPRKRPAPSTAALPSGGLGLASSLRRSARRQYQGVRRTDYGQPWLNGLGSSRAGAAGLGVLSQQSRRARLPACADLRGEGRRLLLELAEITDKPVSREELFKETRREAL